ncbi:hypothetical protein ACF3OE_09610 [Capnocytophaga canis]|uniref:hypothetical protein n=1 Tax=Capnocytophaga canis TaxID=1848903 RepID=UPI00370D4955
MINLLKYKTLTEKLFSEAKTKENSINKKHQDTIQYAGFSSQNDFIIIGEKYYYHFNETKPEQKQELHFIFSSEWKKELYYGFGEFYSERLNKENRLYVRFLMGFNPLQDVKNIGFGKKGNIFCEEDNGNFIYKAIPIVGMFARKRNLEENLKNEFPLKQKIEFITKQKSKLPKIMAYTKAIALLPFTLLLDLIVIIVFYSIIYLIYGLFKLKNKFTKG